MEVKARSEALTSPYSLLRSRALPVGLILLVFALLLAPTIGRQGAGWDEMTDLFMARAYTDAPGGWLTGSEYDAAQTRLSIAVPALAGQITGRLDIPFARLITFLMAGLTMVGAYVFCRLRYDHRRGLLAMALLATSPFFLSFGRVGFSESDIFPACALIWLLVCIAWYEDRPTVGRLLPLGVVMGLGLSAKFTLAVVLPAVWLAIWQPRRFVGSHLRVRPGGRWRWLPGRHVRWLCSGGRPLREEPEAGGPAETGRPEAGRWANLILLADALFMAAAAGVAWWIGAGQPADGSALAFRTTQYLAGLAAWGVALAWAGRYRQQRGAAAVMIAVFTGLAALTFVLFPPEHLTNPKILGGLFGLTGDKMSAGSILGMAWETVATHVLCVWIKSSPLVGLGLLAGFVLTLFEWKRTQALTALLAVILYSGSLLVLQYIQTFYTVPLLPILAVFAADWFFRLLEKRRAPALAVGLAAAIWLAADLLLCYPDFNLSGYPYVGQRLLAGRSSIGYNSVIQTTSDGLDQAIEWVNREYGDSDAQVYVFGRPVHVILGAAGEKLRPRIRMFQYRQDPTPDEAGIVIVHINDRVLYHPEGGAPGETALYTTYDPVWLEANYRKVYAVTRAFDIEITSVWERK